MSTIENISPKKLLFIDRDGTIIVEPDDEQIDSFNKLRFYPEAIQYLARIAKELDYSLILVSNQDGLGTESHPLENFQPVHDFIIETLRSEGVEFIAEHIDRTWPHENAPTRKPGIALLKEYLNNRNEYDIENSFVIGDRVNDVKLAENLGAKAIWLNNNPNLGSAENHVINSSVVALESSSWKTIYEFLKVGKRKVEHLRKTNETDISIQLDLDGSGKSSIETGIAFFDHMLDQIARHGGIDLKIVTKGDLHIDEHHTIEDTGIALGEAFLTALGNKRGI